MSSFANLRGPEIERESFRMIQSEMGVHTFTAQELPIVTRVIHATADFDFQQIMRFHPQAIASGLDALLQGCAVVTDVRMVQVGISARLLACFGGYTACAISDPAVAEQAKVEGTTRSTAAMRYLAPQIEGGIVAIGNAPTALLEVLRQVREEGLRPALIVGVPVGFVNTVESKEALLAADIPYITAVGRKGGSTVAVATVNALLRLATQN